VAIALFAPASGDNLVIVTAFDVLQAKPLQVRLLNRELIDSFDEIKECGIEFPLWTRPHRRKSALEADVSDKTPQ